MVLSGLLQDVPAADAAVTLVATVFVRSGGEWPEDSAEYLSTHYGLPAVLQGSIVVAVGSSFPELASVVVTDADLESRCAIVYEESQFYSRELSRGTISGNGGGIR